MGYRIDPGMVGRHLECPSCHKAMRWSGDSSGRLRCPYCRTRLIALLRRDGTCAAWSESKETVDELILDWLKAEIEEEDDEDGLSDIQEDSANCRSETGREPGTPAQGDEELAGTGSTRTRDPHVVAGVSEGNLTSIKQPPIPAYFRRGPARWRRAGRRAGPGSAPKAR
jgi:hypothetical protein